MVLLFAVAVAIKTGRYTHAKKARDIMEVKGFSHKSQTISLGIDARKVDSVILDSLQLSSSSSDLVKRPKSPTRDVDELERIICQITSVQLKQTTWTPEFIARQAENEKLYMVDSVT